MIWVFQSYDQAILVPNENKKSVTNNSSVLRDLSRHQFFIRNNKLTPLFYPKEIALHP